MYSLIRKDFLLQKHIVLLYIAILLLFSLFVEASVYVGFIFSLSFIMSACSLDEKDNINILLNSLPYTRKEIVASKYIGALLFTLLFVIVMYVGDFLVNGNNGLLLLKEVMLILGLVMITTSFLLPFLYKFKMQYLHMAMVGVVVIYLLTISFFIKNLHDVIRALTLKILALQEIQLYFFAMLIIVILYIGSWLLSIRIYERKVF
ncbi:ABC-2 transporter permease [Lysinibacillus parviboronicapiens]|uniref:ABC-2 transporter permease n=1 Tax=Lysinibacillus parviboronicapiens TaxID=436516 RepID=UPI000D3AC3CE|nr:ABC-2 transporter permease [Lysinibacillus parviboronicapiens]